MSLTYRMNDAAAEAVAKADAELNNVLLPNYTEVVATLARLVKQASRSDSPSNAAALRGGITFGTVTSSCSALRAVASRPRLPPWPPAGFWCRPTYRERGTPSPPSMFHGIWWWRLTI